MKPSDRRGHKWMHISVYAAVAAALSCAPQQSARHPQMDPNAQADSQAVGNQAAAAERMADAAAAPAWTEATELTHSAKGVAIKHATTPGFERFAIATGGAEGEYRVEQLTKPDRLVIDLLGVAGAGSSTIKPDASDMVSQVRVGAHGDKTRVVLDLTGNATKVQEVVQQGSELVVLLKDADATAMLPAAGPEAKPEMIAAQAVSGEQVAAPEAALPAAPAAEKDNAPLEIAAAEAPSGVEAPVALEAPVAAPSTLLKNFAFEGRPGSDPAVRVSLSNATHFDLKRTAPSEYVLEIADAALGDAAAQTLIAPAKGSGIRTVRPTSERNTVRLRFFAEPTTALVAKAEGDSILVTSTVGGSAAQILAEAPDAAKPADEKAEGAAKPKEAAPEGAAAPAGEVAASGQAAGQGGELENELDALLGDKPKYSGRLISLDLQDTDIDNALRIIAEVSNLNIIASDDVTGKVTLRLIDVPWDQALDVILKTNGLDKVQEGNVVRIAPVEKLRQEREALKQARDAEEDLEATRVVYRRVSYARAADLKPLIESVVTERGVVSYDERTNQVIIKDISRGIVNAQRLISKLDLRTPQVLLETQIVEAQRSLLRELGAEVGFQFIASPETGNPTGYNFPNAISASGSAVKGDNFVGSNFPAAMDDRAGSAVTFLLQSADGTKTLGARVSGLEREGRVRVVSRPSVVTTNNKAATIKSVEKLRVKTPSGGLSVATGAGASASGSAAIATETIEIGIVLEVTPQASPDYYVLLDVNAKSSTLGAEKVDGIPSEIERSATSTVLVSSGQTFAMGGIYKIADRDDVQGVPFLKDIPFLGHLFRSVGVRNTDEELLFFITPRIVEGSFDDAAMEVTS